MNIRNEIKAQIVRAGMTMQEVVDQLSIDYGWSESVSNLSGKLQRESIRYKEVLELAAVEQYIPGVERMQTRIRKYDSAYKSLKAENAGLKKQVDSSKESIKRRLEVSQQLQELEDLRRTVENIPPEILDTYSQLFRKEQPIEEIL